MLLPPLASAPLLAKIRHARRPECRFAWRLLTSCPRPTSLASLHGQLVILLPCDTGSHQARACACGTNHLSAALAKTCSSESNTLLLLLHARKCCLQVYTTCWSLYTWGTSGANHLLRANYRNFNLSYWINIQDYERLSNFTI